jgi:enoyl-CoA hydratase
MLKYKFLFCNYIVLAYILLNNLLKMHTGKGNAKETELMDINTQPALKNLKLEFVDTILIVKVDREQARNALDEQTWVELGDVVRYARNKDIAAVVVTGGENLFVAGADIRWLNKRYSLDVLDYGGQDVLWELEQLNKPVIAAVGGYALGGGCELAMACDIRIAGERAKFGQPEVNLGVLPGAGGTQRLSRLVGYGRAKELILTGEIIDAAEAYRIGLVNKVVAQGEVVNAAVNMAKAIIAKGPVAVRLAKMAVNLSMGASMHTGMVIEKLSQTVLFYTEDRVEGTGAFIEKRPVRFQGR